MGKKFVIAGVIITCIVLLLYLSLPAIAIWGESLLVKCDINNPYVNNRFCGWNRIQIEDFGSFLIPNGWSLEETSGIYWIINDSGEAWAFGAVMGSDVSHFANYKELIAAAYDMPYQKLEIDPFSHFSLMNGSDIDLLRIYGDMPADKLFCIQMLVDAQKEVAWMVMTDLSLDEAQYEIAEAIVYSYAFNV
jgi:hypothetical protein